MVNGKDIKQCDTVAIVSSLCHNTLEVHELKWILSAIYISWRLSLILQQEIEYVEREKSFNDSKIDEKRIEEAIINFKKDNFFRHCTHDFTLLEDGGVHHSWYLALGNNPVSKDDFDRYLTRAFSFNITDEYNRQFNFMPKKTKISVDKNFKNIAGELIGKTFNTESKYSKKIQSALRLYFKLINLQDIDDSIITYATVLETLLLKEEESGEQRIKVSARCACLLAHMQERKRKSFVYDIVYQFYGYRNKLVHEGKSILELEDDYTTTLIFIYMRNIIAFIFKFIIEWDINSIDEIINVVEKNKLVDSIGSVSEYGSYTGGIPLLYQGELKI